MSPVAVAQPWRGFVERVVAGHPRKGLLWHFQGSGKSLLMVFAARKLRLHPALRNPTVLIVVDRRDLKTQLSDDFDAYLYIDGPGLDGAYADVDGGGGLNARIDFVAPQDGVYRLVATSYQTEVTGAYRLRVTRRIGDVLLATPVIRSVKQAWPQADIDDGRVVVNFIAQALRNDILRSYNRQVLATRDTTINNSIFAQLTGTNASAEISSPVRRSRI